MGYTTKQSALVANCLLENKDRHMTAESVYNTLKENGERIGKTTVYRQLDKLVESGVIRKYTLDGGTGACFQYTDRDSACREHFHLKCQVCGKLFHAQCEFLSELSHHIYMEHGFLIDGSKTVLYGTCKDCSEAQK